MSEQSLPPTAEITPWENPVRKSLESGTPVVGVTITTTSIEIAAQVADMGFDFLWIEMEHSPITLETARNIILATRGSRTMPFIRVPVNELWTAKRVMDMGALGVIFPFINSTEGAKQAANACKYPPIGVRGSGAGLATFRWPAPGGYYDFADKNIMVVTNIEEAAAVENIDAIAATPGIDVLFIGTSDLSFSLGLRGRQDEPALHAAIKKIVAAGHREGKAVGRPLVTASQYGQFVDEGFSFFQAQTELNLLAAGAEAYLKPLGKWCPSVGPRPMY
ncbi:MAG TPA: aldolase/citrate lyase family protein [Bryobacteraceae bacterium]|nr:aldolase/citrate lyase family protein [Bryobacteraceae bacterium]